MKHVVRFEDSNVKFYTTHSYKGMEDDNIRLANENIYALSSRKLLSSYLSY